MYHQYNHLHVCQLLLIYIQTVLNQLGYQIFAAHHVDQESGQQFFLHIFQDLLSGINFSSLPFTIIIEDGKWFLYFAFYQTKVYVTTQLDEKIMLIGGPFQIKDILGQQLQEDFMFLLHYQTRNVAALTKWLLS